MIKFEVVNKFKDSKINLIPVRKTKYSAGYDMYVAKDIVIPPYIEIFSNIIMSSRPEEMSLEDMANFTKTYKCRPSLVSTGVKCQLDPDTYLELSVRSSTPLKHLLFLANGVGIIDADYYNNEDNEGEIFFQLINLSPYPIRLKAGDCIGQGIIKRYEKVDEDMAQNSRKGGFGSTDLDQLAHCLKDDGK